MQFPWYVHYSMVSPLESDTDGTLECVQYYNELPNAESPFHTGVETDDMEQYFSSVKKLFKKYNKDYLTNDDNVRLDILGGDFIACLQHLVQHHLGVKLIFGTTERYKSNFHMFHSFMCSFYSLLFYHICLVFTRPLQKFPLFGK